MNMRLVGVVIAFAYACQCIASKDIEHVASYIQNLHSMGYNTIFSLFDVNRSASPKEITKKHSKLIKECYMAKVKGKPMPVGKNLTEGEAKMIIVNGYQILMQEHLRKAYNWILDEAHPQFMENYKARAGAQKKGTFYMPSVLSLGISMLFTFIVYDVLRVCISFYTEEKKRKSANILKKQKKNQKPAKIDMKEMYIYKGYEICHSIFNRFKGSDKSVKSE
ncbi:hypothetical protein NEMIN01_0965 [Nematocida minor]|uniref:uncharacterized protein n=1 Tax=Nematocida minor TaxID=1912983 RepID=UPI00221F86EB|nr:uncharacterized protein NEMIN01_0965 [Nematocida minor]KAI5190266.1 hypothetical protein NEMIN01_0965 [Nematocida minor]